MNYSTAIFLVNDAVRCVEVAYDQQVNAKGDKINKDIRAFKTLDADMKKDDLVLIPTDTRFGYTVGKVHRVDIDVDYESSEIMRWVVGKMDPSFIDGIIKMEEQAMAAIRAAEVQSKRDELKAKLMANNPKFDGIGLLTMGQVVQKETFTPEETGRGGAQVNPQS